MAKGFKNSIENIFNRMVNYTLATAVFTVLVGIMLLFLPGLTNKIVGVFGGIIFLITGLNTIYKYLHRDGAKLYSLNLVFGIVYLVLGALMIVYPYTIMEFVTICLGVFIVVNGLNKGNYAIWLKKGNEDSWLITLASGALLIVIGILVIFNPFASLTLTQLMGAFLIINGVLDFTDTILFKKRAKEIREIFW